MKQQIHTLPAAVDVTATQFSSDVEPGWILLGWQSLHSRNSIFRHAAHKYVFKHIKAVQRLEWLGSPFRAPIEAFDPSGTDKREQRALESCKMQKNTLLY